MSKYNYREKERGGEKFFFAKEKKKRRVNSTDILMIQMLPRILFSSPFFLLLSFSVAWTACQQRMYLFVSTWEAARWYANTQFPLPEQRGRKREKMSLSCPYSMGNRLSCLISAVSFFLDVDYSSGRRMPIAKLNGHIPNTTTTSHMPTATSLQDINSQTQRFHWNKEQRLISLPE